MAKHGNHASSCDKCELKAPGAPFFNVSNVGYELAEVKDDNHDVTLAGDDCKHVGLRKDC